jgi:hypothetical protein
MTTSYTQTITNLQNKKGFFFTMTIPSIPTFTPLIVASTTQYGNGLNSSLWFYCCNPYRFIPSSTITPFTSPLIKFQNNSPTHSMLSQNMSLNDPILNQLLQNMSSLPKKNSNMNQNKYNANQLTYITHSLPSFSILKTPIPQNIEI